MVGFEATIWFEPSWECTDFVVIITLGCKFEGKERERRVQEKWRESHGGELVSFSLFLCVLEREREREVKLVGDEKEGGDC